MRSPWPLALAIVAPSPLLAQFGTAAANPPPEPPRRGAAIHSPKVHRHYSKNRDVSSAQVNAYVDIGIYGDTYTVTCGYAYRGKTPPPRLDALFITITHAEPYGHKPDDPSPSLTIKADTLDLVLRRVVSSSVGSFLEYDDELHYPLDIALFRTIFDADSADFRVRGRTYRMRGRAIEVCRWLGDRVADGSLPP